MKRFWLTLILLALAAVLPAAALAWEGHAENRYFYNQLDADERAVYNALASAAPREDMSAQRLYVSMPERTSRYSSTDFVYTAWYAFDRDNPLDAAWISGVWLFRTDGSEVPFDEERASTPDFLPDYDALVLEIHPACTYSEWASMMYMIEGMADSAVPGMSRYDRAAFALEKVSGRLTYLGSGDLEILTSPLCILRGYANCEGFSKVYKILADALDLPCVFSEGYSHMYVLVQMEDGLWYLVEPQGHRLLEGLDQVSGNTMYVPRVGPAHWELREGHGAVTYPPIAQHRYSGSSAVPPAPIDPPVPVNPPVSPTSVPAFPEASYGLTLRNRNVERIRPQCGPGRNYAVFASVNGSTKLYKPQDITYLAAHFCVGDWVYVEFGYTDGVLRYCFFEKSLFSPSVDWSLIPAYSLASERHGTIINEQVPYNGPGTHCGSYASCRLSNGDSVYACMEYHNWFLCRFYNGHGNNYGTVYLWVPGSNICWD